MEPQTQQPSFNSSPTPHPRPTPLAKPSVAKRQFGNPLFQSVLLIVFLALFIWFVLLPKNEQITTKKAQLTAMENQRKELESESEELNRLVAKLESSDKEIKTLDEALPLDVRPTSTSLLIDTFANAVGLQVSQITINSLSDKVSAGNKELLENQFGQQRKLTTSEISVVVSGNIDRFKNFLVLLEESGRILDVVELNIAQSETITYRLKLKAYEYGIGAPDLEGAELGVAPPVPTEVIN